MKGNFFHDVSELLDDWKCLVPRWNQIKDCDLLKRKFCVRNRNPLFDISSNSYFNSGLGSLEGLQIDKPVLDHYVQRAKAVEHIFEHLNVNPNITVYEFLEILKKYCSVVKLTKKEHSKVTSFCRSNKDFYNFQVYELCGIKISGLSEIIPTDFQK